MAVSYELTPCPVCDRTDAAELASRDEIKQELEELWSFHLRRLRPGVPVGALFDRVVFSQDPPLRLARCAGCGTVYRNPRERGESVVDLYADEQPDADALQRLFEAQRDAYRAQAERLTGFTGGAGDGLEVGSYVGAFLAAAETVGWSFEGLDVNASAVEVTAGRGLRARRGTLEDAPEGRTYDAVAIWNCFDQLPDPRAAVATARGLLREGGVLAIRVPNGAFYARWRPRIHGPAGLLARSLLSHNNLLGFPYRHGFDPDSLGGLLHRSGFRILETTGDTLVPVAGGWTRGWAALEERLVKAALRAAGGDARRMPWFEIYARAT